MNKGALMQWINRDPLSVYDKVDRNGGVKEVRTKPGERRRIQRTKQWIGGYKEGPNHPVICYLSFLGHKSGFRRIFVSRISLLLLPHCSFTISWTNQSRTSCAPPFLVASMERQWMRMRELRKMKASKNAGCRNVSEWSWPDPSGFRAHLSFIPPPSKPPIFKECIHFCFNEARNYVNQFIPLSPSLPVFSFFLHSLRLTYS